MVRAGVAVTGAEQVVVAEVLLGRKLRPPNPVHTPKVAIHLKLLFVVTAAGFQGKERDLWLCSGSASPGWVSFWSPLAHLAR